MSENGEIYDIIIIGGGPAGFTAALYASRARRNVLLLESLAVMGEAVMTEAIENFPGIKKISGFDFIETLRSQAEVFGLKIEQGTVKRVYSYEKSGRLIWKVEDEEGNVRETFSVIIATGAGPRKIQVPGEKEFLGRGVSYCALCDGAFFRDKNIVVVGGGDAAVEEALFLTRFGKDVTLVHRRDKLRAVKILQERAFAEKKLRFIWNSTVEEIKGSSKVEKVVLKNLKTNILSEIDCDGIFIFAGWQPNTDFVRGTVKLDEAGSINVDSDMKTSQNGIFGAGDCCKKSLHQIITACADGALAAFFAGQYVDEGKFYV